MLQPQHGGAHFAAGCGGQTASLLPKPHFCNADERVASLDIGGALRLLMGVDGG